MVAVMSAARQRPQQGAQKRSKRALNDYSVEVGQRIVQARKELGLTQEELAELAGVSQRSMQAYETGEVIPYRKMRELSKVLEVETSWLLHGQIEESDEEVAELKRSVDNLTKLVRAMSRKIDQLSQ